MRNIITTCPHCGHYQPYAITRCDSRTRTEIDVSYCGKCEEFVPNLGKDMFDTVFGSGLLNVIFFVVILTCLSPIIAGIGGIIAEMVNPVYFSKVMTSAVVVQLIMVLLFYISGVQTYRDLQKNCSPGATPDKTTIEKQPQLELDIR